MTDQDKEQLILKLIEQFSAKCSYWIHWWEFQVKIKDGSILESLEDPIYRTYLLMVSQYKEKKDNERNKETKERLQRKIKAHFQRSGRTDRNDQRSA